jgi:hydrogenase expression/formation protein HypD
MKYIEDFRDARWIKNLIAVIRHEVDASREYRFMEFCGGHTHSLYRYGLLDLLPDNVRMIHGPGCPVCVLPRGRLDNAIELAQRPDTILCSYGDMLRVPASGKRSLLKAKASGADVRMVYSTEDALRIAREHPQYDVIFFAVGFETTTPPTAVALKQARTEQLDNFSVFCNHVLTPPAMRGILAQPDVRVDGFVGPGHVSTVIGHQAYAFAAEEFGKPVVIAGFEPADLLRSIHLLIRQVNEGRHEVENEYSRAVSDTGNVLAQRFMQEVFSLRDEFEWRGLGMIPHSALRISDSYAKYDAEQRFLVPAISASDHKACIMPMAGINGGLPHEQGCTIAQSGCEKRDYRNGPWCRWPDHDKAGGRSIHSPF